MGKSKVGVVYRPHVMDTVVFCISPISDKLYIIDKKEHSSKNVKVFLSIFIILIIYPIFVRYGFIHYDLSTTFSLCLLSLIISLSSLYNIVNKQLVKNFTTEDYLLVKNYALSELSKWELAVVEIENNENSLSAYEYAKSVLKLAKHRQESNQDNNWENDIQRINNLHNFKNELNKKDSNI